MSAQECVGLPSAAPGTFSYGFGGTAGASWTSYTAAWNRSTGYEPDGRIIERITVDGEFDAVRVPVGLSVGKSFTAGPFRFYPHAGSALVLDYERLYDCCGPHSATCSAIRRMRSAARTTGRISPCHWGGSSERNRYPHHRHR